MTATKLHAEPLPTPSHAHRASPAPTTDEIRRCVEILESFVDDRVRLSDVPEDVRVALLKAAGRVSRPMRYEQVRAAKAFRRIERKAQKEADRETRAATEI